MACKASLFQPDIARPCTDQVALEIARKQQEWEEACYDHI